MVTFLEGTAVGLVALLMLLGAGLLMGLSHGALGTLLHVRGADALVVTTVLLLVAGYASGIHRDAPWRWATACAMYLAATGLYVLGAAAGPGEAGAEGRAHVGAILGGVALDAGTVRLLHAAVGTLFFTGALALAVLSWRRRDGRRVFLGGVGAAAAAVGGAALLFPVLPAPTPELAGIEAASAPWPVAPLVALESHMGLVGALLLATVLLGLFLSLPFLDQPFHPPWVRRFTTLGLALGLVLFLLLLVYVSLAPPAGSHLIVAPLGGGP